MLWHNSWQEQIKGKRVSLVYTTRESSPSRQAGLSARRWYSWSYWVRKQKLLGAHAQPSSSVFYSLTASPVESSYLRLVFPLHLTNVEILHRYSQRFVSKLLVVLIKLILNIIASDNSAEHCSTSMSFWAFCN